MDARALFVVSFLFWLLLTWPFDTVSGEIRYQEVVAGLITALLVSYIFYEKGSGGLNRYLQPKRYFWAFIYLFVLGYYVIKANLDVAYRVLHPSLPINPGIIKIKTRLKSNTARTVLANSVTLTPGTLTIDMSDDGFFHVHWINVTTLDPEAAATIIIGRFEWFLLKIFDH